MALIALKVAQWPHDVDLKTVNCEFHPKPPNAAPSLAQSSLLSLLLVSSRWLLVTSLRLHCPTGRF